MKEQTFFADPAIDRLMNVVFSLAADLHTVRTRCRALEGVLVSAGAITPNAVENWRPGPEQLAAVDKDLEATVRALFAACIPARSS